MITFIYNYVIQNQRFSAIQFNQPFNVFSFKTRLTEFQTNNLRQYFPNKYQHTRQFKKKKKKKNVKKKN